jgi:hypothetical protein
MLAQVAEVTAIAAAEAWIGFAGGILATAVSALVAIRQSRHNAQTQVDLARLNSELQAEVQARSAQRERELRAEDVLTKYREPLAAAAFDLQSRLYNILHLRFFAKFGGDHERCAMAEETTLFRIAQYFGWTEILRRDIQFLSFPEAEATRHVVTLQSAIRQRFGNSHGDEGLMIWADEQRAIGERMIVQEYDRVLCAGYARFHDEYAQRFAPWCEHLRSELQAGGGSDRLRDIQHLLCELVETLDERRVRYTQNLDRA